MRSIGPFVAPAVFLAGCTTTGGSGVEQDRPRGSVERANCVVSDPEGEVILHPGSLSPSRPTTVRGTSLIEAANVEAIEISVVAFAGSPQVQGIVRDYPPLEKAGIADSLADWETRQQLADLLITPADGQQAVLAAVRLVDRDQPGHLRGVRISSSTGEGARDDDLVQPVLLLPDGDRCDVEAYESTTEWSR